MGGFSVWHWLIVLLIVVLVFGTKKLGNIGSDLGRAIREFKKGLGDDEAGKDTSAEPKLKADAPEAKAGDKVESETRDRVD